MGGGGGGVDVKDSEDQKMMARVAKEKWQLYQEKFVPLENEWMQDVASWNDETNHRKAAGIANTATQNAYGTAMNQLLSQGGNVGRLNTGINNIALGINRMRDDNTNRMQVNQQNQYIAGLQNINRIGAGKETTALNSMSDAAGIANTYAQQQAVNSYRDDNQWNELAGMGIGAAMRGGF